MLTVASNYLYSQKFRSFFSFLILTLFPVLIVGYRKWGWLWAVATWRGCCSWHGIFFKQNNSMNYTYIYD